MGDDLGTVDICILPGVGNSPFVTRARVHVYSSRPINKSMAEVETKYHRGEQNAARLPSCLDVMSTTQRVAVSELRFPVGLIALLRALGKSRGLNMNRQMSQLARKGEPRRSKQYPTE